ncbi:hypothetical protein B0H63DRAFT_478414 [Podospora didyma]|uniref:GST N-terminal domain-containing protein n=1 Tax=Podospora didyma TaxID=330526 RepID=A0AAE0KKL8_9PEZI|nr:hypothetical protein B0H63DRAFT_478414 [Podospora didyma]
MTYRLFITNKNYSSWSLRPWLLMRQLDVPFVEEMREIVPGSYSQPQWKEFSPVAHVPCLHVSNDVQETEQKPVVLWESIAIVEFLNETFPDKGVYPKGLAARSWARSAVAEMHAGFSTLRDEMGMSVTARVELGDTVTPGLVADLKRLDELWTEGLGKFGGPFLAGDKFTAADAFFAPVVFRLQTYLGARERLGEEARAYADRILKLEGMRQWESEALKETGWEPVHDDELVMGGKRRLVEDLRKK